MLCIGDAENATLIKSGIKLKDHVKHPQNVNKVIIWIQLQTLVCLSIKIHTRFAHQQDHTGMN
jgi:hypothetical protein